jgi:hypothetical protein
VSVSLKHRGRDGFVQLPLELRNEIRSDLFYNAQDVTPQLRLNLPVASELLDLGPESLESSGWTIEHRAGLVKIAIPA